MPNGNDKKRQTQPIIKALVSTQCYDYSYIILFVLGPNLSEFGIYVKWWIFNMNTYMYYSSACLEGPPHRP